MSATPKFDAAERQQIAALLHRRRRIARLIATLTDKLREIPTGRDLARSLGAHETVVYRIAHGEPYKSIHPRDKSERNADAVPS